ncbi:MAG: putative zinc transporter ZupT [Pseudomonadota bacterium]|jgi:ZIP family zinc transporter
MSSQMHSGRRARPRIGRGVGLAIVTLGLGLALQRLWLDLGHWPALRTALAAGGVAALATALGVLPMLLTRQDRMHHPALPLGFGAGVMLGALGLSLLQPAVAGAAALGLGPWPRAIGIGLSLLAGAAMLMALERLLPHEHLPAELPPTGTLSRPRARRLTLLVLAMVVHNIPEGWALGVAALGSEAVGVSALTLGIALQNVPEGLVVAAALQALGVPRWKAALLGAASGVVEPVAAVLAALLLGQGETLLPWGLAMAAGAMLFVVSHEVIPESHRPGHERRATLGLLAGFTLMLVIATGLEAG